MLHIVHRQHTERTFLNEIYLEEDNRVPVIVRNPAYVEELEPDEEVDQADVTPLTSGDSPIITVPASEDKDVVEDASEDDEEDVPHIP